MSDEKPSALDETIKHWHAAETEADRFKEALVKVLRLQTGVSQQAKTIIREALAASVTFPDREGK